MAVFNVGDHVRDRRDGLYGVIYGVDEEEPWYRVAFDSWQFRYVTKYRNVELSNLQEVVVVDDAERRELLESFEVLVIDTVCFKDIARSGAIVIYRTDSGLEIVVWNWFGDIDVKKSLEGTEASSVLSSVLAINVDGWVEPRYNLGSSDPESCHWTMEVYSGDRFFMYGGISCIPQELVDVLLALADAGLPPAWDGNSIIIPVTPCAELVALEKELREANDLDRPVIRFAPMTFDEVQDFFKRGGLGTVVIKSGERVRGHVVDISERHLREGLTLRIITVRLDIATRKLVYDHDLWGVDVTREPIIPE